MTAADPTAARAVADQRLQTVARGIQGQVDRRVRRLERSSSGLRQITVASRDPAALTCQVYLDGDTSTPVPCRPIGTGVVPIVGQQGWALASGTDLLLTGMRDRNLPIIRLRSTGTLTTGGNPIFPWATGDVDEDTDIDEQNRTMFDDANNQIAFRWPGLYDFGAHLFVAGPAGALAICRIQLNGGTYIDAWQDTIVNSNSIHDDFGGTRRFAAGDTLQVEVSSTGGATTWGTSSNELGMAFWASYRP